MSRVVSMMSLVGLTLSVTVGCGESPTTDAPFDARAQQADVRQATSAPGQPTRQQTEPMAKAAVGPEEIVTTFLEAVRSGNEQTAAAMLTPLALKRTAEYELSVAPPGSPTAEFSVGDIDYVEGGGAHVASTWSDVDTDGSRRSDALVWMLRLDDGDWRIAGLATTVFPDQPPMFLNFEDPEDMLRKQQLTEEEITRRAAEAASATNASTSTNSAAAGRQAQLPQQPSQRQVQLPPSGAATPRR